MSSEEALIQSSNSDSPPTELAPIFFENVQEWGISLPEDYVNSEEIRQVIADLAAGYPNWPAAWIEDFDLRLLERPERVAFIESLKPPRQEAPDLRMPQSHRADPSLRRSDNPGSPQLEVVSPWPQRKIPSPAASNTTVLPKFPLSANPQNPSQLSQIAGLGLIRETASPTQTPFMTSS